MSALLLLRANWRLLIGVALVAYIAWLHVDRADLRAEAAKLEAEMVAALREADEDARNIEAGARDAQANARIEYANQMAAANDRLRSALERLRHSEAERASLGAASTAPAECGRYECPATRLSVSDAAFLVGEADRADRVVLQLGLCQRELRGVVDAVNRSGDGRVHGLGDPDDGSAAPPGK